MPRSPHRNDIQQVDALLKRAEQARKDGDLRSELRLYRLAARRGSPVAQFRLGLAYEVGRGVARDRRKAQEWLLRAANEGLTSAAYRLARILETDGALEEAAQLLTQAAFAGHPKAQAHLAELYYAGRGVARDPAVARQWEERASAARRERDTQTDTKRWAEVQQRAEQGQALAQLQVAREYTGRDKARRDDRRAEQWYLRAAENPAYRRTALEKLALLFDRPDASRDIVKAIKYYELAAEAGSQYPEEIAALKRELTISRLSTWGRYRFYLREIDWKARIAATWRGTWPLIAVLLVSLMAALTATFVLDSPKLAVGALLLTTVCAFFVTVLAAKTVYFMLAATASRVRARHLVLLGALLLTVVVLWMAPWRPPLADAPRERQDTIIRLARDLTEGNVDAAIRVARASARRNRDLASLRTYGDALAAGRRFSEAAGAYSDALKRAPRDTAARLGRAAARWMAGDVNGAVEDYRVLTDIEPDNVIYRKELSAVQAEAARTGARR